MLIGDTLVSARCGSRGCLSCHRKKLRAFVAPALELGDFEGEKLYSLVITPKVGRVYTQEDVNDFLASVRLLLRKWRQYYGLGHAYWVAECVVKWDEEYTNIRCPVLESVEEGLTKVDSSMADCHIIAKEAVRGIVEECLKGDNCPFCRGKGYLPAVHLHVHVAMSTQPFWYGRGNAPVSGVQDFGGRGLKGFIESVDLGFTSSEELKQKEGIAGYISKACMMYMSKVDGTKTHHKHAEKTQDWEASQNTAMVASAIYGQNRHRGTIGRAYGLRLKTRNPKLIPQFVHEAGDGVLDVDYQTGEIRGGGFALAALDGRLHQEVADSKLRSKVRLIARYMDPEPTTEIKSVQLGKKLARSGFFGPRVQQIQDETINVLIKTQVDGVSSTVEEGTFDGFYESNFGRIFVRRSGGSSAFYTECERVTLECFSKEWVDTYLLRSSDVWFSPVEDGCVLGKGRSVAFLPIGEYHDVCDIEHWLRIFRIYGYKGLVQELKSIA